MPTDSNRYFTSVPVAQGSSQLKVMVSLTQPASERGEGTLRAAPARGMVRAD